MASMSYSSTTVLTMDDPYNLAHDASHVSKRYSFPLSLAAEPNPHFVFPPRDDSLDEPTIDLGKPENPPFTFPPQPSNTSSTASPFASESTSLPSPNPPFSFAAAQAEALNSDQPDQMRGPEHPSFSRNSAARSAHRSHAPPPLPAFSFNPSSPAAAEPSPTSPLAHSPGVPRSAGHRRRVSEFIGGDGKVTSPGLMSTSVSPTRADNPLPLPAPTLGPPAGRRHAHRRSTAISISSVDLGAVRGSPSLPASSAPPTPAYTASPDYNVTPEWTMSPETSSTSLPTDHPPLSPSRRGSAPESMPRTRVVEFADTVTFIRPLSTISSDTGSSQATIRGSHSITNSISSVVSSVAASSSQTSLKIPELSTTPEEEPQKPRPRTADPSMASVCQPDEREFAEFSQRKRPLTAIGQAQSSNTFEPFCSSEAPDRKKWFGDDEFEKDDGSVEDDTPMHMSFNLASGQENVVNKGVTPLRKKPSTEFKRGKRTRNVRNWAGSILSRKGKDRAGKQVSSRRTPTPPLLSRTVSAASLSEVNFDDDNIIVLRDPNTKVHVPAREDKLSDWKPTSFYEQSYQHQREDSFSPVIDLDAALGPFNTPEMGKQAGAGSSFSAVSKRMHSGGRRGEFIGPEMRYHRRAESAPEMPPVDRAAFGVHRLGSNSTMNDFDVFDEEEEDEFLAGTQEPAGSVSDKGSADEETTGLGVSIVDSAEDGNSVRSKQPSEMASIIESPAEAEDDAQKSSPFDQLSGKSEIMARDNPSIEIVDETAWTTGDHRSSGSTITPMQLGQLNKRPASSPVDFAYPFPQASYSYPSNPSSAIPSPDPSSIYFEPPRSATGSSSMTDRQTLPSIHSVERGANMLRPSNEDMISFTSEASDLNNVAASQPDFGARVPAKDRAASYSAPTPRRGRRTDSSKRGSIISLSQLMGGSSKSTEKSKLRHETKADDERPETPSKRKSSGAHRLSRVFSFLKPKDKSDRSDAN